MRIGPIVPAAALACIVLTGCTDDRREAESGTADDSENWEQAESRAKTRKWERWLKALDHEFDGRDVVGTAAVSLVDAIRIAHAAKPGTIVGAVLLGDIEDGTRSIFYDVRIAADGGVFVVEVDTGTGKVASMTTVDDTREAAESKAIAASIPAGAKGLDDLVVRAQARAVGAHPFKVGFEVGRGRPNCIVTLLRGGDVVEVDVDPAHPDTDARPPRIRPAKTSGSEADEDDDEEDEMDEDE